MTVCTKAGEHICHADRCVEAEYRATHAQPPLPTLATLREAEAQRDAYRAAWTAARDLLTDPGLSGYDRATEVAQITAALDEALA